MITTADRLRTLAGETPRSSKGKKAPEPSPLVDTIRDAFLTRAALPRIVYPSILNATGAERAAITQVLDSLPLRDVANAPTITMRETLGNPALLGVTRPAFGTIELNRTGYGMDRFERLQYTLVHEVGHTVDAPGRIPHMLVGLHSSEAPFGTPPHVSDYAATQPVEDFAESYTEYRLAPERLQEVAPEKMRALEEIDRPRGLEALLEQPAFRESGKALGQALEAAPWIRTGAEFLGQFAVLSLGVFGSFALVEGVAEGDARKAVSGLVRAGAAASLGLAFQHPALGPVGLALLGADHGLQKASAAGASAGTTAAAMAAASAGGVVGGMGLPLGLTWAGYQAAGPVGGAVGLVLGSVVGHRLGASLGAKAALALGSKAGEDRADAPQEKKEPERPHVDLLLAS